MDAKHVCCETITSTIGMKEETLEMLADDGQEQEREREREQNAKPYQI